MGLVFGLSFAHYAHDLSPVARCSVWCVMSTQAAEKQNKGDGCLAIIDVIKYEGDNSTFVWKHPCEDFNTMSKLIVHESQEAVLLMNGQPLDTFGPGRYVLETKNIPILRALINLPQGGVSSFHCEVYFINKVEQMAIRWGTDSRVQYIEPTYGFPISVGANGEMSLKVLDSKRLLFNLVGTERILTQSSLTTYFRAFLMTKVKTYMAQTLKADKVNIFEIDEKLQEFSDALKEKLKGDFADYGVSLERFFVTTLSRPESDAQYLKFKDLHFRQYADIAEAKLRQQVGVIDEQTAAQRRVIEAQGIAQKRSIEGYTYQQERGFDVAENVASNEGAGNFSSVGIGLGMMAGVGKTVGNIMNDSFNAAVQKTTTEDVLFCENCGTKLEPGAAFCDECGTPVATKPACVKCGYVFERPGKFCPKCGTKR